MGEFDNDRVDLLAKKSGSSNLSLDIITIPDVNSSITIDHGTGTLILNRSPRSLVKTIYKAVHLLKAIHTSQSLMLSIVN